VLFHWATIAAVGLVCLVCSQSLCWLGYEIKEKFDSPVAQITINNVLSLQALEYTMSMPQSTRYQQLLDSLFSQQVSTRSEVLYSLDKVSAGR